MQRQRLYFLALPDPIGYFNIDEVDLDAHVGFSLIQSIYLPHLFVFRVLQTHAYIRCATARASLARAAV